MLACAAKTVEAPMAKRRGQFGVLAGATNAAFAASGSAGSEHTAMIRKICASEIELRANMLADAVLGCHKATSGTSAARVRQAAKVWIMGRISYEAHDVERHFAIPDISEIAEPPTMSIEAGHAIGTSSARIDAAFDALKHDYVERAIRVGPRVAGRIRRLVLGQVGR